MRFKGKRLLSVVMAFIITVSTVGMDSVYASPIPDLDISNEIQGDKPGTTPDSADAESPSNPSTIDGENNDTKSLDSGETDEAINSEDNKKSSDSSESDWKSKYELTEGFIKYLVIEKPMVLKGEVQNIVIAVGEEGEKITDATLLMHRESDETAVEAAFTKYDEGALLFEISYNTAQKTSYALDGLKYTIDEEEYYIDFKEIGIEDAKYGVNIEVETDPDIILDDEEKPGDCDAENEIEVTFIDEDGEEETEGVDTIAQALEIVEEKRTYGAGNLVVVLDPGHGGSDSGTTRGGVSERDVALKIAQYAKAELEQYIGVSVYLTRNDNHSPLMDRLQRTQFAAARGANVIVSLHINAGGGSGAEVWVPTQGNWAGEVSRGLANSILAQLTSLGLNNRGQKDGTGRGLGMIVYPQQYGIPGILVEHCFIDSGDIAYINNENNIKNLGVKDATAIAKYYGLVKEIMYTPSQCTMSNKRSDDESTYTITAQGIPGIAGLRIGVWSEDKGQDDLRWYNASKSGSDWVTNVPISNHKSTGKYIAHAYIVRRNGSTYYIGATGWDVDAIRFEGNASVKNQSNLGGFYDVVISGLKSTYGVQKVSVPSWTEDKGQDDLVWYTAVKQANGDYVARIDVANHKSQWGKYISHVYVKNNLGEDKFLASFAPELISPEGSQRVSAELNPQETKATLKAENIPGTGGALVKNLQFAVWSDKNGQDDLVWYNGGVKGSGDDIYYEATFDIARHKTYGKYNVHVYKKTNTNASVFVGATDFYVSPPTVSGIEVEVTDPIKGKFDVTIKNLKSAAGITKVRVPTWSASNQNDIKWYEARRVDDTDDYVVHGSLDQHKYNLAKYNFHVYVTTGQGIESYVIGTSKTIGSIAEVTTDATDQTKIKVRADKVPGEKSYIKDVRFAVWSNSGGQDDLKWYTVSKDSITYADDGNSCFIEVPIENHKTVGAYSVHVYQYLTNGANRFLGGTSFTINNPKTDITTENVDKIKGTYDIRLSNIVAPGGVSKIEVAAWTAGNQNDLKWYTATADSDNPGDYIVKANIANHKFNIGNYNIHTYITTKKGLKGFAGGIVQNMTPEGLSITATPKDNETKVTLYANNVPGTGNYTKDLRFAVWSEAKGQDDLRWYTAYPNQSGEYTLDVHVLNHKTAGKYFVHAYSTLNNNSQRFVGATTFNISNPTATIAIENPDKIKGTFDIRIKDISSPGGVSKIEVPTWSASNQNDIKWYVASEDRDNPGEYIVHANVANHKYNTGKYNMHVYITTGVGFKAYACGTSDTMTPEGLDIRSTVDEEETEAVITAENVPGTDNYLNELRVAVWSNAGGQDDLRWYNLSGRNHDGDGKFTVKVPISNHKTAGAYTVHVYSRLTNNTDKFTGATSFTISSPKAKTSAEVTDAYNGKFKIEVKDIETPGNTTVNKVQVAMWTSNNQNDIKWYDLRLQEDGSYLSKEGDIGNHRTNSGKYNMHIYITTGNNVNAYAGSGSFTYTRPANQATVNVSVETNYTIHCSATNVFGAGGKSLSAVRFAVWSAVNGQDDLHWYTAGKSGNTFSASTTIAGHGFNTGIYNMHVYAYYAGGSSTFIGSRTFNIEDKMSIMGASATNAGQLVRYYRNNGGGWGYPGGWDDAPNIETLAQIYMEECARENVRAEVAFAQCMKETNFLRFTGRVPAWAKNFAGMGAIDSVSTAFATFPSCRIGVRAQVQHLKAYASTAGLNSPNVDPRFHLVTRGCAQYVEWLGQKENPWGKGWATAVQYGYSLADGYVRKLLKS